MPQPPSPLTLQRFIVGAIALAAGTYVVYDTGRDFQFIKYEPFSKEEVERRKQEGKKFSMTTTNTRTLDYTPEAKERLKKLIEEKNEENEK